MCSDDPFTSVIDELEEEYGIVFPDEMRVHLIEMGIQAIAQERGQEVPGSLQRLSTLSSLNRLYGKMRDQVRTLNDMTEGSDLEELDEEDQERVEAQLARMVMHDEVLMFFILAQDLIETRSIDMLNRDLIDEEFQDSNNTIELLDRDISQPTREALLYRCGIIGHELFQKMQEFRRNRNDLVHNTEVRQAFIFDGGIMTEVDKGIFIINEFQHMLEGEQFWREQEE